MEKTLANYTKKFVRVIIGGGAAILSIHGAFSYIAYQNKKEYSDLLQSLQENPQQNSQTPDLGVGDLLYFNHDCMKSFSARDIYKCATHKMYRWSVSSEENTARYRQGKWDNSAVVIKSKDETKIFHLYYGALYQNSYEEFVNLPYITKISMRKLESDIKDLETSSNGFIEEFRDLIEILNNSYPNNSKNMFRDTIDLILNFWKWIGVADAEKMQLSYKQCIGDIDCEDPHLVSKGLAKYSKSISIK